MSELKPIETIYNGYRFRSRLEARWAVFFDTLGVKYEYEKEGYDLDGMQYLPDFWIEEWNRWVEIKPKYPTFEEVVKCQKLSEASGKSCMFICGSPWAAPASDEKFPPWKYDYRLATVHPDDTCDPGSIWTTKKGTVGLGNLGIFAICRRCPAVNVVWIQGPSWAGFDTHSFDAHLEAEECGFGSLGHCCDTDKSPGLTLPDSRLISAYTAARQARFEYGEDPGRSNK